MVDRGDKVIVCRNGVFSGPHGGKCRTLWRYARHHRRRLGAPGRSEQVEETLKQHPDAKVLAFVHAETSTVRCRMPRLCALAQKYGCLTIVDTVTSLGGVPVNVDDWGADAVYSGSQKCLSCTPGLSPIHF